MARPKSAKDAGAAAPPQITASDDGAPDELVDGDEWISVTATDDYIGQSVDDLEMSSVTVTGGRWSGVTIERLLATDVVFSRCDLSGFVLQADSSLRRVAFTGCRMSGAVFAGVQLGDVSFTDCTLDEANLRMARLERVAFDDCPLAGADFYGAKVESARLARCDLRGAVFTKAVMSDVDLRTSVLEDVIGADALRGATIDSTQLIGLARSLAVAFDINVVDDD